MTDNLVILVLAAGRSRRMRGADKLIEPVEGTPLLVRICGRALESGHTVLVTLPVPPGARGAALGGLDVRRVAVPDADEGMAASIRRGVAALPAGTEAVMIVPADMPELTATDFAALGGRFDPARPALLQAAGADGTPGHPVLFPRDCFPALAALSGDRGARDVLSANRERLVRVPLPGRHALTDLDTPEAWAAWRGARE